jgi:hypothetical protein
MFAVLHKYKYNINKKTQHTNAPEQVQANVSDSAPKKRRGRPPRIPLHSGEVTV